MTPSRHTALEGPARAWSIAALALVCVVLGSVLLYRPGPSRPHARHAEPVPQEEPALTPEQRRAMYRAWPMFEGWPLPQLPPTESQRPEDTRRPEAPSRPPPPR
ncbi:hypothetical protein LY474_11335 [Myxococcus stipitatus]|uniref:hypothetical protein n=1 Tax=Myxococcus stipitatus TaxID=83455 RepID=UPI001F2DC071|nr:hypothetical protein [Myxococcus stipitatus]MCE9668406.1 hypothetical protein [Myxococcus stipitatus]